MAATDGAYTTVVEYVYNNPVPSNGAFTTALENIWVAVPPLVVVRNGYVYSYEYTKLVTLTSRNAFIYSYEYSKIVTSTSRDAYIYSYELSLSQANPLLRFIWNGTAWERLPEYYWNGTTWQQVV